MPITIRTVTKRARVVGWSLAVAREHEREWQDLCRRYLPVESSASVWRFNSAPIVHGQGWKLHISATIRSACAIFRRVAPYLDQRNIMFKAPKSLAELSKLNAGLPGAFSQVGKFIVVFPATTEIALALAPELHRLTRNNPAPAVPYDVRFRKGSCVYYRYGAFSYIPMRYRKKRESAIIRPDGRLVRDRREPGRAVPSWLSDPFQSISHDERFVRTRLEKCYHGYEALRQRGRGGIYKARERKSGRICILKEGRRHGETDWLGQDGFDRVRHEALFLKAVGRQISGLPRMMAEFRANDCYYLVLEAVGQRSLDQVIRSKERISRGRLLKYCFEMARILAEFHAAGWAWSDCKPGNFLVQKGGRLRPIDFESCCPLQKMPALTWVTAGYLPKKWREKDETAEAIDLYALGVSCVQVATRRPQFSEGATAFRRAAARQSLPLPVQDVISKLLSPQPRLRPSTSTVARSFSKLLSARH